MRQILGGLVVDGGAEDGDDQNLGNLPNALNRITGPTYSLTDIIRAGRSDGRPAATASDTAAKSGPIKEPYLSKILEYLFPDSKGRTCEFSGCAGTI